MLKPYIWRDFKSMPPKLKLSQLIKSRQNNPEIFKSSSIDYVHLRPEHVLHINSMCERHFWNGIDVSECLQYPDYTIVALYKKLIVGFAFMVPLTAQNQQQQQPKQMTSAPIDPNRREMYLSFIFVHSDWRESNRVAKLNDQDENETSCNISIAQYMLFYLIKVFLKDFF